MTAILITNFDTSKIFIWNNRFPKATYTNGSGSPVTLTKGRILGRITTGQKVTPQVSTATDGSQQPIGVLADDYVVAAGATITVTYCDSGDVAEEKLILAGVETLSTIITDDVSVRDAIARNTHLKLVPSTNLTNYDNQ